MEIIILPESEDVYAEVTRRIISLIQKNPKAVLGLATGRTMLGVYSRLVKDCRDNKTDLSGVTTFNLDEYLGVAPDDPESFRYYMEKNLFKHVNLDKKNIFIPSSLPGDVEKECGLYEERIRKKGRIDLQLLGIGRHGHIGFNEPSSSLRARTRVKTLTDETLRDNFGKKKVARFAITMGIGTILDTREVILVAVGDRKAVPIAEAVEGPITSSCPASMLQFHEKAKVVLDEKASKLLKRKEYYKWVWEHKKEAENIKKQSPNPGKNFLL